MPSWPFIDLSTKIGIDTNPFYAIRCIQVGLTRKTAQFCGVFKFFCPFSDFDIFGLETETHISSALNSDNFLNEY